MEQIIPILHEVISGPLKSMFIAVTGLFIVFCGMELGINHLSNYISKRKAQREVDKNYTQNLL